MKLLKRLNKEGLINPPKFLLDNVAYLCYTGSVSYGVSDLGSDVDIAGFCFPPKKDIFPHLSGYIHGFDPQPKIFEQYEKHHIKDYSKVIEYDISIFSITKFFKLCLDNNPNFCDMLFSPRRCIMHSTAPSEHLRGHRHLFLHKGAYIKFKSYAYSQLHKAKNKIPAKDSNRYEDYITHGYSTKFIYHLVRLLDECEQILSTHDLDLQRNKEQLKDIRAGNWTLARAEKYFELKERHLEDLYSKSSLRNFPDKVKIKTLLLECLEEHYGSLSSAVVIESRCSEDLKQVFNIVSAYQ